MRENSLLQGIFVQYLLCGMVLGIRDTGNKAFKVALLMELTF